MGKIQTGREKMKQKILSLRNIYKFLTLNDYPVYSQGITKKENRIGLTLTRFCYDNILIDFRNRKCGKVIWRADGERNRYVSAICNRSDYISLYAEYAEEIAAAANEETVLRQIRQFMAFLLERQFNADVFRNKLPAWISILQKEDPAFTEGAADFFYKAIDEFNGIKGQGMMVDAFCCGYILTFLIFHALMGNGEGEEVLRRFREDKKYSFSKMYHKYQEESIEKREVEFLGSANTELSGQPLKQGHFFGREAEMFEIREMLMHGGAFLISGMGGIGKTELMRQFLKCAQEENLVDYICVVQYEGGLARSLVKAFPEIHGTDAGENFREALAIIRSHAEKRILIVVDNMDGGVDEKELDIFLKLPATIFITSRYQRMKGLKTYHLKPIGKEAGSLIFRDNYGSRLSVEDKNALEEILDQELWCHTLTLRLLARTAKNNQWNLTKLQKQLETGNIPIGYTEAERYEGIRQVYAQMYEFSNLTKSQNALLRLLAAFPYGTYQTAFIKEYLQNMLDVPGEVVIAEQETMEDVLEKLWAGGWLEKSESGYSMHPFIAECVLHTALTELECIPFFEQMIAKWQSIGKQVNAGIIIDVLYENNTYTEIDGELIQTTMMLRTIVGKLSGKLTERYVNLYLMAAAFESIYYGLSKDCLENLKKIKVKASKLSAITNVALHIMLCSQRYEDLDSMLNMYEQVKVDADIPENMIFSFAEVLGSSFYHSGQIEKAESLHDFILEKCKEDSIRMAACHMKACIVVQRGDHTAYEEWMKKGIEIGYRSSREQCKEMLILRSNLCDLYMAMGMFSDAEQLLDELENIRTNNTYFLRQQILFRRGSLAMYRGDEGFGVELLKENAKLAEQLYVEAERNVYASCIINLAMALNKAKQFEESARQYQKALDIYNTLPGYAFEKHRILNNMSVMYLDRGMPETALEYLPEAYERGKVLGGLALGETVNNLSKAYRALGNREKELEYLKEAAPILEQFYGSEHPKVVDAKARLTEE